MTSEISFEKARENKAIKDLKEQLDRERAKTKQTNGKLLTYSRTAEVQNRANGELGQPENWWVIA